MMSNQVQSEVVLYIDDDEANLTVFEAAFGAEFNVVVAPSAAIGLELLERHEVAVLLVDQRMPKMTGTEVAEIAREKSPDTIRYLITAYADLAAAVAAINRGQIRRYLHKPWNPVELRAALSEGLDYYRSRRRIAELERRMMSVERIYGLGVVAASIAHELRNPMSVVCATLPMVGDDLEEVAASLGDDAAARLRQIRADVTAAYDAAIAAVDIMRGIERSSRRETLVPSSADLAEIVRTTLAMMKGEIRHRALCETELASVPLIRGSTTRLGQVVLNLITNAVEALPAGRHYSDNLIVIRLKSAGDQVELEVEDNAGGIPSAALGEIFDPFFTTKDDGGTGLGLAISKQIVEESGGELSVRNRPGQGACFRVVLPAAK